MKLNLRRVRLNAGGYTAEGYYFGVGAPLYLTFSDCGAVHEYLRAPSREAAKAALRLKYPGARFYR